MKYQTKLEAAIAAAPEAYDMPPRTEFYHRYASEPDDCPIPYSPDSEFPPSAIVVPTIRELKRLEDEFLDITEQCMREPGQQRESLGHERDHGRAALALGARAVGYGIQVITLAEGPQAGLHRFAPFTITYGLAHTKLSFSLVLVYPKVPS